MFLFVFFLFMCGIVGVQLFHGQWYISFAIANSSEVAGQLDMYNGYVSFDHIGVAILTVVNMVTLDNWQDVLYELDVRLHPTLTVLGIYLYGSLQVGIGAVFPRYVKYVRFH